MDLLDKIEEKLNRLEKKKRPGRPKGSKNKPKQEIKKQDVNQEN